MDRARVPGRPAAPAGPGMAARGRGMHPTSSPLLPDVAPPPSAPGRKPAGGKRAADRGRRQEFEEKELAFRPSRRREAEAPPPITREITISEGITVKELSEKLGVKASMVIKKLLDKKVFATINQTLDSKLAEEMSRAFGASINQVSYEQETVQDIQLTEVEGDFEERPPVVTIMGHVDHGKTSLLDAIRFTNVADKEAGGITQHIGAYSVDKNGKKIVFVDTPGHAAFTRMRARGAKVTDIVVLVVAADDGIMPQTDEAINHARAADVPIIVAINKIDKPDAQLDRIKQQLTERGLMPEDWGGSTVTVPVSAKAGTNLDLLLEMILLSAEILELKANRARPALATVLEAQLDKGRGPVATVIVRNGVLRAGDHYICGPVFGRVRAMFDDRGNPVKEAGPSMPVEVLGLESVPDVGDTLQVVTDTAKAKQIAVYRESKAREIQMAKSSKITLERFHTTLREGEMKELLIVLKADVGGTAEVIAETLEKLSNEKVRLRVILTGVGAINESDILLASASNAIVVGFNVRPDKNAIALSEQEDVDIRLHTIIYELTDEVKAAMTGMLEPVYKEVFRGRAEVRDVFRITKIGTIAGSLVVEGTITRDSQVRLLRDNTVIHTGKISSLKRFKDDASEVRTNLECGIGIENYNDIKPGDVIEAFVRERVQVEAFA
jgi:translation initiation factor IF-2